MEKIIKKYGKLHSFPMRSDKGYRLINKFLTELIFETLKASYIFYDKTGYLPFAFKERQLHSVLCPSLFKLTQTSLMEVPLKREELVSNRKRKQKNSRIGWVDYTCCLGNPRVDLFIEIKHAWNCLSNNCVRKENINQWKEAINQLKTVKGQVRGWLSNKGAIRIAILFTIHWEKAPTDTQLADKKRKFTIKEVKAQHENILGKLNPKPLWSSYFHPNQRYIGPFEYEESKEYHPAISCYAYVNKLQEV